MKQPTLLKRLERRLVRAVWRWQRQVARRLGVPGPLRGGAVVFTQWFGSSLQLTPHLHALSSSSRRAASGRPRRSRPSRRRSRPTNIECIDTLIGDIMPPAELMKTQTDRKIAEELQRTYEAQLRRQLLERETSVANMQAEVVRSEQMVAISQALVSTLLKPQLTATPPPKNGAHAGKVA